MIIDRLKNTIDIWIHTLYQYDIEVLQTKPEKNSWSLGQVYMHLLEETNYYIEQVEYCLTHGENQFEEMADGGVKLFANNGFPDEKIEGDPAVALAVLQPDDKTTLIKQFTQLKARLLSLAKASSENNCGKTKHPGLGYFTALEWLQFSEMHMRHHLRQKIRIEDALQLRPVQKP